MGRRENIVLESPLFDGIAKPDGKKLLADMRAAEKKYEKGETIIAAGSRITSIGILSEGTAQIIREDLDGNRAILSELEFGDIFGEAYAAAGIPEIPIMVVAASECYVTWIDFDAIAMFCAENCGRHRTLMRNMMRVLAQKNVWMNEKMRVLGCKTTREKLMTYLSDYAERVGKRSFRIPFNRIELADYLGVDRSAMSREISRMRADGLIRFERNHFELLQPEAELKAEAESEPF